jgi:hypothetical protein
LRGAKSKTMRTLPVIFSFHVFAALTVTTSACAAPGPGKLVVTYDQYEDLKWRHATSDQMPESAISRAQVYCTRSSAQISVIWNSESSDWAVSDQYRSGRPFFSREIRFAQYNGKIKVTKTAPYSKAVLELGSAQVDQYRFLVNEIKIWSRRGDVPFKLPNCARKIFEQVK